MEALPVPGSSDGSAQRSSEGLLDRLVRVCREVEALEPPLIVGGPIRAGLPHLSDAYGAPGPLAGLLALLLHARDRDVIACACDLPHVSAGLLARLASEHRGALVLAPRDPATGKWQPLFARYDGTRMLPLAQAAVASGTRSMQALLQSLPEGSVVELALSAEERALLEDWDRPIDAHRAGGRGFFALEGPLLIAHRGACLEHVENSLPAFDAALALGADVIESDVHVTRDGHAVLCHDADGARIAGDARKIASCALAEVQRWDLARGKASEPVCMPTLDQALARFPQMVLNLDVKPDDVRAIPRVLEVIAKQHAAPRVLLTSFFSRITRKLRALGYQGPVGLGREEALLLALTPAKLLRAPKLARSASALVKGARLQIPTHFSGVALDRKSLIDKAALLAIPVDYWVVNDVAQAEHLLALGAQGIVTDDVRAMATLFARSPHTHAWRERHPELASS